MAVEWVRAQIRAAAIAAGGDPALALAVAREESGLNPTAVGDAGHSVGLFQENDQGAGYGLSDAERSDIWGATTRFIDRVRQAMAGGASGAGEIAYAAQRPANRDAYVAAVDSLYAQESVTDAPITRDVQPIGSSSSPCPPGQVLYNGVCGYIGRGGFIPADSPQAQPGGDPRSPSTVGRPGAGGAPVPGTGAATGAAGRGAADVGAWLSGIGGGIASIGIGLVVALAIVAIGLIGLEKATE